MASNGRGPSLPPFETCMETASDGERDREGQNMEIPERGRGIHLMRPNRYAGPYMNRAPYINANGEETEEVQPNQEVGVNRSAPVRRPTIPGFEDVDSVASKGMRDYVPNEVRGATRYGRIPGIESLYDAASRGMRDQELEEERRRQEQALFEREVAERLAAEQWRRDEEQQRSQQEKRARQEQITRQEQIARQELERQQRSTPDVDFTNDDTYDKAWERRYYDYPEDWPESRSKKDIQRKNETAVPVENYWVNQGPLLLQSIDTDAVLTRQQNNTQGLCFPAQSQSIIQQSGYSRVPQQHTQGIVFPSQSQGFQPMDHNTAVSRQQTMNQILPPAPSQRPYHAASYTAILNQDQANKQGLHFPAQAQLPFQHNNQIANHTQQWGNNQGLPFRALSQEAIQASNHTAFVAQQEVNIQRHHYSAQSQLLFHRNNQIAGPVRPWESNQSGPFLPQPQATTTYSALVSRQRGYNQRSLHPQGGFRPTDPSMVAAQQWENNQRYGFPLQFQSAIQHSNTANLQAVGHPFLPSTQRGLWGQEYQPQNLDNSMYPYGANNVGWSSSEGSSFAYPIRNKSSSVCPVSSRKKGSEGFQRPGFEGCDEDLC